MTIQVHTILSDPHLAPDAVSALKAFEEQSALELFNDREFTRLIQNSPDGVIRKLGERQVEAHSLAVNITGRDVKKALKSSFRAKVLNYGRKKQVSLLQDLQNLADQLAQQDIQQEDVDAHLDALRKRGLNRVISMGIVAPAVESTLRDRADYYNHINKLITIVSEHIRKNAALDGLTGLFNKEAFYQAADQLIVSTKRLQGQSRDKRSSDQSSDVQHDQVAILLLDLDKFKVVNDTLGHGAGDAVLVKVAEMLKDNARAGSVVSRIGGDEYALAAPVNGQEEADQLQERIQSLLTGDQTIEYTFEGNITEANKSVEDIKAAGYHLVSDGNKHTVTIPIYGSVGHMVANLDDSAEQNLGHVDREMYASKARRKAADPSLNRR